CTGKSTNSQLGVFTYCLYYKKLRNVLSFFGFEIARKQKKGRTAPYFGSIISVVGKSTIEIMEPF
ncbi:hypothetical protein, partial [Streptococcus suis]|uniref:hypothetical protein n=1 Tax=Streptococcus suis TaxID=1307 RepID=UPI00053B8E0A